MFPIPIPPPASLPIPSLWVFPVHQARALVSCIQPGLVICFTLDSILVSMLFSQNILPSSSPTSPKVCSVHLCTDIFKMPMYYLKSLQHYQQPKYHPWEDIPLLCNLLEGNLFPPLAILCDALGPRKFQKKNLFSRVKINLLSTF